MYYQWWIQDFPDGGTTPSAHAEFSKQSGEFGEATGDKFKANVQELSALYAQMSELCKRLNLPGQKIPTGIPYC